jgi:hypothetical protein
MNRLVDARRFRAGSACNLFAHCTVVACLCACQGPADRATDALPVQKITVNGTEMAYVEDGKGETFVFVHGAAGDWRSYDDLRPYIAQKYRYVAPSRRYHWPNAWTDDGENYTMAQNVEDVAAFIRALDVGKVHLFGGS